jgi:hypothetical protein
LLCEHFPDGEQILDSYHCAAYVYETARAQYGEGTLEAQESTEATLTRLGLNQLGDVIGGLLRMQPRTPEAEVAIRAFSIYLAGQHDRVGYEELRRRGLPRGSGGIESANKLICHVRLKRSGAWWLEANGNAMLRIRCALYNGTFKQIFADYMTARDAKGTALCFEQIGHAPDRSTDIVVRKRSYRRPQHQLLQQEPPF